MARLEDLIDEVQDQKLRASLRIEVARLKEGRRFGLVFRGAPA
jgi:hypothetical protein